jgi:putative ABC transport system ATP-binding protein
LPSELSGGQRQRVAIARAIASAPDLLLCDEPTGNLDDESSSQILSIVDALNQTGTTVIIVTHDESVAERAERHIRISEGVITEDVRNLAERDRI